MRTSVLTALACGALALPVIGAACGGSSGEAPGAPEDPRNGTQCPSCPHPLDTHDESRVAGLTGMSTDAAKTFLDFHTGMRWLPHRDDFVD